MPRPQLTVLRTSPPCRALPAPRAVPDAIQAEAENIRGRIAWALLPLTGKASTDIALSRSRAELYAIATALQKLARQVPR